MKNSPAGMFRLLALAGLLLAGCGGKNENPDYLDPSLSASSDTIGVPGDGTFDGDLLGGGEIGLADRGVLGGMMPIDIGTAMSPVYFSYDSSSVAPSETYKVQMVAQYLRDNGTDSVIIEGHADERGSREYNLALGERRALAVRGTLISLGISADRIQTRSYGEETPAVFGHDESAYAQNRRAEFQMMR